MSEVRPFTIIPTGKQAQRFEDLARLFETDSQSLARQALQRGLKLLESASRMPGVPNSMVLFKYIMRHWKTQTDVEMGIALNCSSGTIWKYRKAWGLLKQRGNHLGKRFSKIRNALGSREEVEYALINGGKMMTELAQEKNLGCTRERVRQFVEELGLTDIPSKRTLLWYANRFLGPGHEELAKRLVDAKWVTEQIKLNGSIPSWAGILGISEMGLLRFIERRLRLNRHGDTMQPNERAEMVSLTCSGCGNPFKRRKKLVEFRRKQHPEQKTFFCKKRCQGIFFREGGYDRQTPLEAAQNGATNDPTVQRTTT